MKLLKSILIGITTITILGANQAIANTIPAHQDNIPKECIKLFQQAESLVAEAEKQPGTHTHLAQIKNQLDQSKKELLSLDDSLKAKSCSVGLAKLNKNITTASNNRNSTIL